MGRTPKRDTWKQSLLASALADRGIQGGWREWLLSCRKQGMSAAQISRWLAREMDLEMDDSTLTHWTKQARQETDNGEESTPLPVPGTK